MDEVLGELGAIRIRRRRRRIAISGAVAAFAVIAAALFRFGAPHNVPASSTRTHSGTASLSVPERRILPDGSVVELNHGALIAVAFGSDSSLPRRVALQRGEAHFEVAKNKDRPFIVSAGGVEVRAVGTAFSVDLTSRQVEVIVTEGRVAVDDPAPHSHQGNSPAAPQGLTPTALTIATVDAGNRVVVPVQIQGATLALAAQTALSPAELTERMAWRLPRLEFSGTPLSEAVAMFNQHNEDKLLLSDQSLGRLQVSGFLRADKTETFVLMLETDFGIKAERRGPHEVLLSRP